MLTEAEQRDRLWAIVHIALCVVGIILAEYGSNFAVACVFFVILALRLGDVVSYGEVA